jgi:hypothetical protein
MVCGNMSSTDKPGSGNPIWSEPEKVLCSRSTLFQPPEFIPAGGYVLPSRWPACKNYKECQLRMNSLSFKENAEYEIILSKLKLDEERKKWVAAIHTTLVLGN